MEFRFGKGKIVFIENNMACNIYSTRRNMETLIAKMIFTISNEYA
jgi:hypothetical protein